MRSRREFLRQSLQLGAAFAVPAAPQQAQTEITVEEVSIASLQEGLTLGRSTSVQLVERYFARIAEIDKGGPRVNAVIELNPDAVSIARALDSERKEKGPRSPLHGIPILIKD